MCDGSTRNLHTDHRSTTLEASHRTYTVARWGHLRQRLQLSRHFTAQTAQSTEIVNNRKVSAHLNTGPRYTTTSTGKSAGCVWSTTESTRSTRSAGSVRIYNTICDWIYSDSDSQEWSNTRGNTLQWESITHTKFQDQLSSTNRTEMEKKHWWRQIQMRQDRGMPQQLHPYRWEIQTCIQIYSQIYRRIHPQIYRQISQMDL